MAFGKEEAYLHTGILLQIKGKEHIVEVQKHKNVARTVITPWANTTDFQNGVYVDNCYLQKRGIHLQDMMYRLSRIVMRPLAYGAL